MREFLQLVKSGEGEGEGGQGGASLKQATPSLTNIRLGLLGINKPVFTITDVKVLKHWAQTEKRFAQAHSTLCLQLKQGILKAG